LLSQASNFANAIPLNNVTRPLAASSLKVPLWTDDFNGLLSVMRWREVPVRSALPGNSNFPTASAVAKGTKVSRAIERFQQALAADPNSPVALNNLACLLATAADPALRNGPEAVRLAEKACALTEYQNTSTISTLAAAYAEVGRFDDAIAMAEKACALAREKGQPALLAGNQQMLEYFRQQRPFHQPGP
jgi:tetratricopeptide (TPR) repeat protein